MLHKLAHFSFYQLVLLRYLLKNAGKTVTVKEISKHTMLEDKSLGGVLSSLSRTKYRGVSLLEPQGRAVDSSGLRWRLNTKAIEVEAAKKEVQRLLLTYE